MVVVAENATKPSRFLTCDKVHNPLRMPRETISEPPKMVRTWCDLYILTWKCASCHNGVHFFDILTSKNGPYMVCFVHFDLEMYFAPQRRALFRHLNCQKWSAPGVFCEFSLRNLARFKIGAGRLSEISRIYGTVGKCVFPGTYGWYGWYGWSVRLA